MSPTGQHAVFQIHPTRRCNLECSHCYSESGPHQTETVEGTRLLQTIGEAAVLGYNVLGISGGEPLLYPSLVDVLDHARSLGMISTVTTNAMLLTREWVELLSGRVSLLAVSLDGTPETHVLMRRHPNAFSAMERNVARLRDSGIAFGFIVTLTQHNVHELSWVADFAAEHGASMLQVHPLELEGNAAQMLPNSVPDVVELLYAAVETVRLRSHGTLQVQLDVNSKTDIATRPEQFFAGNIPSGRLGSWLSPLVLESSGQVVPVSYGFGRRYALGNIGVRSLLDLAEVWDREPFVQLARSVWSDVVADKAPELCNWYEEITLASRR